MPRISIVVPVYNVEKYVRRCIDSILAQTLTDFELILVDDGSPDNCGEICDEYKIKDERVVVIHKSNGGLADARNTGIEIAKGDFVGFVDSDDYIDPDMYEKLLKACLEHDSKIAMCGRYNVFEEELQPVFSFQGEEVWDSEKAIGNLLTWDNIDSSACDKLFAGDLFKTTRFPVGKTNEDIYIISGIIHDAGKIVHIGESKYYYLQRPDSITSGKFSDKKLDLLDANRKVVEFVNSNYPDLRRKAESFQYKGIIFLSELMYNEQLKIKYPDSYRCVRRELNHNLLKILFNPFINRRKRIKAAMMAAGVYHMVKR
ncbi:MAG: glycosyltransferase [Saccharofermentanales bacterium]